jgi:hypothetical protein
MAVDGFSSKLATAPSFAVIRIHGQIVPGLFFRQQASQPMTAIFYLTFPSSPAYFCQ